MAAGREFSAYQRGIIHRAYEHADTIALQKLSEAVSDLYLAEGGSASRLWATIRAALMKLTPPDDPRVAAVLSTRSVTGLARLVNELSATAKKPPAADDATPTITRMETPVSVSPAAKPATTAMTDSSGAPESATSPPSPEQLKSAMKAFRKRLKLTRLDDESRLGRNPMSTGRRSQVMAIMPPRDYPPKVWDELVRQGKLKPAGSGFYELIDG